jgi:hypothetical protein
MAQARSKQSEDATTFLKKIILITPPASVVDEHYSETPSPLPSSWHQPSTYDWTQSLWTLVRLMGTVE